MSFHPTFSTQGRGLSLCVLLGVWLYAVVVQAACGCYSCLTTGVCYLRAEGSDDLYLSEETVPSAEFRANARWGNTATLGGSSNTWGTPQTVTWGFVADGTTISDSHETSGSSLIDTMNNIYGIGRTIELSPWFTFFEQSFDRWSELSGLTYVYEPNDGGAAIDGTTTPSGQLGVYPDVRIGGHRLDGGGGTLAYNYYPAHGDMVLDTSDGGNWGNTSNNSRFLRNVVMHEAGHGLGLAHLESNNSGQLMEPTINTGFDGPQIDDILGVQRLYGDVWEKNGGNDLVTTAMQLGEFAGGDRWSIGADGGTTTVSASQVDFISIDDDSDIDYFHFSLTTPVEMDATLTQLGRTYNEGPQGGSQSELDASILNQLEFDLQISDGGRDATTLTSGYYIRGLNGRLLDKYYLAPGDYYIRVTGSENSIQLYQFDLQFYEAIIPGDYNYDGIVDNEDYEVWAAHFGSLAEDLPEGIAADGNGDGIVNAADYTVWQDALANNEQLAQATVPEPASAVLFFLAALLVRRRIS